MVSVLGAMLVVAAGLAYHQHAWPISALLGLALHMAWHVVDGADGDLARLTGKTSPIGEMVDGLCDYLSHVVLYACSAGSWRRPGWSFGVAAGWWLLVAGLSHAVQSNHVEVQRRQYQWWVYGTPWLRHTHADASSATAQERVRQAGFGLSRPRQRDDPPCAEDRRSGRRGARAIPPGSRRSQRRARRIAAIAAAVQGARPQSARDRAGAVDAARAVRRCGI